ncbi:MAG: twin-arginine translocation signal domain-containing protein, partial [Gemmatimonadales bacterium]
MVDMNRRQFLKALSSATAAIVVGRQVRAGQRRGERVNLLFIMTDQQRWDAMGCAGNAVIKTPNLDRLATQGARFTKFYSSCPVCVPARTVILTGHGLEATQIRGNKDQDKEDGPKLPTFDQVLLRGRYRGEYHGKWHSPYKFSLDYTRPVRWLNGKNPPPGCKADESESGAFRAYLAARLPKRELRPGELTVSDMPYTPDPLDSRYGKGPDAVAASQADCYGCLNTPPDVCHTAWTASEGIEALDRLKDGPFTLTISIGPPHPPMVVARPYYGMYPAESIHAPANIDDPRIDSPYRDARKGGDKAYRDKGKIRQMTSVYYGMVSQVDEWVGKILARLEDLNLADRTLVIFTSDHGEMLGEHGMHGKGCFYEGAVHVPLLMRLPGIIPPKTVVTAPASHVDLLATILDYCGTDAPPSQGSSLRPLIEGKDAGAARVAISEWNSTAVPGFMVCDGRWKLLFGRSAEARSLDALYDLQADPGETRNLLAHEGERDKHKEQAERLKAAL